MLKPLGLYIHIPFCVKKCHYCDFNSFSCDNSEHEKYVDYLIKEIDTIKKHTKDCYFDTIFMGGGTPSILSKEQIERICTKLKISFYIDDDVEWTIEANPGTVTLEKLQKYIECGINRISMGVQSLNEKELKEIGRIHGLKEFMESYAGAKIAGFENINYDLMFSLPSQTEESFKNTLEKIMLYNPTHISAYSLQLEEGTPMYLNKEFLKFPSDEENRRMYETAKSILKENGFNQYEISNFAKKGYESRHNLKYWSGEEYIGIGMGASSYFNSVRYDNPENLEEYYEFVDSKKLLYTENSPLSEEEKMSEFMFMGLRKVDGIDDEIFKEKFNKSFFEVFKQPIEKHIKNGLLIQNGNNLRLTSKGLDLANTVMCDFV